MKKLTVLVLVYISSTMFGQGSGIGYANVDYILSKMPETKQLQAELESHNTQLSGQLQAKYQIYQQKLTEYQQGAATMIDAVRKDKEAELTQMQQEIQSFEQNAQISMQQKQQELLKPVYQKVGNAIETVAKKSNFEIILNSNAGGMDIVLYGDERIDVSDRVLTQMGIVVTN